MARLLSGSTLRRGGSGEFLDLKGAQPQLPPSPSTSTGYTIVTDDKFRTTYRSSLGNLEFNSGTVWSNIPDGNITLLGTGTGFVHVSSSTNSTSTDSGALVVTGGLGVGLNSWFGKDINVNGITIGQGYEGINNIVVRGVATPTDRGEGIGQENIAIGYDALQGIQTSYRTIAIGRNALSSGTNLSGSIAIGDSSLENVGYIPTDLYKEINNIVFFNTATITSITNSSTAVVTVPSHGYQTGDRITIRNVTGISTGSGAFVTSLLNDHSYWINVLDLDNFELYTDSVFDQDSAVNSISIGTSTYWTSYQNGGYVYKPAELTVPLHDFSTGTRIVIENVEGCLESVDLGGGDIVDTEAFTYREFYVNRLSDTVVQLYEDSILGLGHEGRNISAFDAELAPNGTARRYVKKNNNVGLGSNAGRSLYDGEQNFFFGDNIAPNLTTGSYNFFMGHDVATYMTRGSGNISIMGDNLKDGVDNQVNIGGIFYYNGNGYLQLNSDVGLGLGTESTGTDSGALVVLGGMGISGDIWVGGTIYGNIEAASTTTKNILGGAAGSIVYQTSTSYTGFLEIGPAGSILVSDGQVPIWSDPTSTTAANAENIFLSEADSSTVHYVNLSDNTGTYTRVLYTESLKFDPVDDTLITTNLSVKGTAYSTTTITGQSLEVAGGIGVAKDSYFAEGIYSRDGNQDYDGLLYTPRVYVSATAPANPRTGDVWLSSGAYLQYINDGGNLFWIQIGSV